MGKTIDDEVLLAVAKKGGGSGGTGDYPDLSHKPQINGHTLEGNKTTSDLGIRFQDLPDAPTIPDELADLQDDSSHRLVTDTEKATWNGKSNFSGNYSDLNGLPTLGTASSKNVPASGDASSSQVVMGNDSRLTDSRPASDVSSWAKQSTKPTYTASEVGAIATTQKGVASGVAELDANGKVPSSQLPSYVDDVIEGHYDTITDRFYTESTFENVIPPESGKSWVDVASNKSYRWTGSVYSRVDEGVQLGETSGSAYRGDRGKVAYDHSQTTGNPHGTTADEVMMPDGTTSVGEAVDALAEEKAGKGYYIAKEVQADGVKTYKELINTLFNNESNVSMTDDFFMSINQLKLTLGYRASTHIRMYALNSTVTIYTVDYATRTPEDTTYASMEIKSTDNTFTNLTDTVPSNTTLFRLYRRV